MTSREIIVTKPRLARRASRALDHLPGEYGPPIIGRSLESLVDPHAFIRRMYEDYGPVCRTYNFSERRVLLLDPDAAEIVLMDRERNFSSRLGWDRFLGRFFPRGLMLRDFDDHRFHRSILQEPFKKPAMEGYLAAMNPYIASAIGGWPTHRAFHFYDAVKRLTLDIASLVFLGIELGPEAERINRALKRAVGGSVAIVQMAVPGLAVWRGLRGRETMVRYLGSLVDARRRVGPEDRDVASPASDMLSRLCQARAEDGSELSDDDVVSHMIFMLLAAHDTTTSALATIAYALARHPEWQERLRDECSGLSVGQLAHGDLPRLKTLEWVFKEALRLYPPVPAILRRTRRETDILGHRIPANAAVSVDVAFIHRMHEYWSRPDTFDPERFSEARAEHKGHRYCWLPFSGGAHMCLGLHFAYMSVKAILHQVLLKYRLTVPDGYTMKYRLLPIPKPADRLPLTLELI